MNDHLLLPDFPRLSEWFGAWAVLPERAESLWAAIQNTDWPAHFAAFASAPKPTADSGLMTVAGKGDKSIAVIPLVGDLMKSRSSMGGTSTVQVRRDIRTAVRNPDVSGILLAIDSPGGTVSGTADLGAEIKAARRTKPVFAQIEDTGASAAYWIASQASRVYASSGTTIAGSIGTVLAVTKEASGKVQVFTSGPLKRPGADGTLTDEQASYLQGLVNGWQSQFDAAVKSGRRLTDKQLASVNSGAVFLANTALELKLIDGIQSTDQTLAELAATK
jgi:signal peptide peptidase SppA